MNCYFRLSTKEEKNFAVEKYMLRLLPVCIICIILFFLELAVFIVFAGNFNHVQLSFTVAKLTLLICVFLVGIIQIIFVYSCVGSGDVFTYDMCIIDCVKNNTLLVKPQDAEMQYSVRVSEEIYKKIHIGDECKCIRVAGQHFMFYPDNLN